MRSRSAKSRLCRQFACAPVPRVSMRSRPFVRTFVCANRDYRGWMAELPPAWEDVEADAETDGDPAGARAARDRTPRLSTSRSGRAPSASAPDARASMRHWLRAATLERLARYWPATGRVQKHDRQKFAAEGIRWAQPTCLRPLPVDGDVSAKLRNPGAPEARTSTCGRSKLRACRSAARSRSRP